MAKKKTFFEVQRAERAKDAAHAKLIKKRILIGAVSAVTLLAVAGLIVLLVLKLTAAHPITAGPDAFVDEKTGVAYKAADPSFVCAEKGDLYAVEKKTLTNDKTGESWEIEHQYYQVKGVDPLKFLCADDGTILYASDIPMPEFGTDTVSCIRVSTTSSISAILQNITEPATVKKVTDLYLHDKSYPYPATSVVGSYDLLFEFEETPGIYYSMRYLSYRSDCTNIDADGKTENLGRNFLYNRYEGRFVPIGDLLEEYIGVAETEANSQ